MKFKFILAIALILCAFCVLPVSAEDNVYNLWAYSYNNDNIVVYNQSSIKVTCMSPVLQGRAYLAPNTIINSENINGNTAYEAVFHANTLQIPFNQYIDQSNREIPYFVIYASSSPQTIGYSSSLTQYNTVTVTFYNVDTPEYDIDVDESENIINLGIINDLNKEFSIGSSQYGNIILYNSYTGINCSITELQKTYVNVRLDENFNTARINLLGDIDYDGNLDSFNTHALIYYNYQAPILPTNNIQAFIQTYDYQNGNMLSGVNMSVYEIIENDDNLQIGNKIYSSINAESQTILTVKNNTEYFIENELTGYFAVKNENTASLNNRYGYLWNPTLTNPLMLYYSRLDPSAQYNANFIVQDVNNNGIAGVSVTMDNSITKISNSIGGLTFNNVSAGLHTFTFVKNGYQSAQKTIDIQLQYAAFTQTLFKDDQIIQPTVSPSIYPTIQPTVSPSTQPTLSPIDKPSNIMESVSFGFAKIFGVKTVENANYIFALMLILFPAVIAGGITHQALGFIAGGMVGFVFALAVGLVPIWVFFAMCLMAVIYIVLKGGNEGF